MLVRLVIYLTDCQGQPRPRNEGWLIGMAEPISHPAIGQETSPCTPPPPAPSEPTLSDPENCCGSENQFHQNSFGIWRVTETHWYFCIVTQSQKKTNVMFQL